MELKVWVEGIQRIVCGVTVNTTCQDVVFALAHATGKVGRFTLIERWRNNERLLAPSEHPLRILMKWGEYSNDVQFILKRSEQVAKAGEKANAQKTSRDKEGNVLDLDNQNAIVTDFLPLGRNKEGRRSFGSSNETKHIDNVGIVKGIPQKSTTKVSITKPTSGRMPSDDTTAGDALKYHNNEFNIADLRNSLDRKTNKANNFGARDVRSAGNDQPLEDYNYNKISLVSSNECYKNSPPISANGALVPPPYRDPPPPRTSPLNKTEPSSSRKLDYKDSINMTSYFNMSEMTDMNENFLQNAQYKDLLQIVKFQREKITSQQADMTKYDAEIGYFEGKERDQTDVTSREISKAELLFRQGYEQLQSLQYVEEENELVKQQEKTLKSEITLLRSKLANCETELLQCRNKIRLLLDEIQIEQRSLNNRQKDNRQQVEKNILTEVERIQSEIDKVTQSAETSSKTTENLKKEISVIESAIAEKKREVEQLVNEMKEVNLQSLTVTPSDEIRNFLEGSNKPGSTRRIIGSPRQLENAVPTSKNPHGVWV